MAARRTRFCLRPVAAAFLVAIAAGCGGDDAADEPEGTASSTEPGSSVPVEASAGTYVIESGDAVSAIADRYCVSAAELAEANEWSDGVDHVIQPGDAIALPANACEPAADGDEDDADDPTPATTVRPSGSTTAPSVAGPTTTVNEYIESYRFDGGVPIIPMLGDPDLYEDDDQLCEDAYYGVMEFERGLSGVDDLVADLNAVGVTPTADQLRYMRDWQEWKDTYLDGYQTALDDLAAVDMGDEVAVEALLAEPAYVEASDAAADISGPAEGIFGTVVTACAQRDSASATAP